MHVELLQAHSPIRPGRYDQPGHVAEAGAFLRGPTIDPIHPGEHRAEILDDLGTSRYRLANSTGVPPRRINEIDHGRRSVTGDTALRIGQALGLTPEFRLNLQRMYDLDGARSSIDLGKIERLAAA